MAILSCRTAPGIASFLTVDVPTVLSLLQENDLSSARWWLDAVREDYPAGGGDDSLAGLPFSRFWEKGKPGTPEEIRYAAASLLAGAADATEVVDILTSGRDRANSGVMRTNFDLALARAFAALERNVGSVAGGGASFPGGPAIGYSLHSARSDIGTIASGERCGTHRNCPALRLP
jgi:hypothetical protein